MKICFLLLIILLGCDSDNFGTIFSSADRPTDNNEGPPGYKIECKDTSIAGDNSLYLECGLRDSNGDNIVQEGGNWDIQIVSGYESIITQIESTDVNYPKKYSINQFDAKITNPQFFTIPTFNFIGNFDGREANISFSILDSLSGKEIFEETAEQVGGYRIISIEIESVEATDVTNKSACINYLEFRENSIWLPIESNPPNYGTYIRNIYSTASTIGNETIKALTEDSLEYWKTLEVFQDVPPYDRLPDQPVWIRVEFIPPYPKIEAIRFSGHIGVTPISKGICYPDELTISGSHDGVNFEPIHGVLLDTPSNLPSTLIEFGSL